MKIFLMVVAVMACGIVKAQDKSNDTTARYFIIQVSIANQQEVAMGKLAEEKATRPDVKAFAERMVTDHGKAQTQLLQLIKARGYKIPREATDTPPENSMLKNLAAQDFDRIYVHMMVAGHGQTVQLIEKYAWTGKDPDANSYAKQTLPVVKEHLAAIKSIDQGMSNSK